MDFFNSDIFKVVIRCIVAMTTLFFMTKLLGKKQVSELSLFDYVVGISIGNFASEMAINLEAEFFNSMLAIIVFGILAYFISICPKLASTTTNGTFFIIQRDNFVNEWDLIIFKFLLYVIFYEVLVVTYKFNIQHF